MSRKHHEHDETHQVTNDGQASGDPHAGRRIVIVEDDASIGSTMRQALESHGYLALWFGTGAEATASIESAAPDLVLLDAGLPDTDGFTLCRWLRGRSPDLPIIIVTARDAEIDVVIGLDAGATDSVTKPFSMAVLLARIRAHLRSAPPLVDADDPIVIGAVRIDPGAYTVSVDGRPTEFRTREFELLLYLARNAGRVVTRDRLLADVWDLHWDSSTKTVDMHVVALRRKLGDSIEIVTVRGVGYRLVAE
ncbi:MAG: DNA-binding response regulator [Ilumatobacteraceae bacterium]|nr:DNA-binding response regulator [Ilumatobacteraceae bacterium]